MGEFLSLKDASFQASLPEVISWLHHERACCSHRQARLKSLYSRLLFLLSRCSRLLISDAGEQPSSNAARVFVAGPRKGDGTSAKKSGRLSLKLRQLLYGDSQKRPVQQASLTDVTRAAAATASSPFENHEDEPQQQQSEAEEDIRQQPPVGNKKTRRKSAFGESQDTTSAWPHAC